MNRIKDMGRKIYIIDKYILTVGHNVVLDSALGTSNITRQHAAYLLHKWHTMNRN